MSASIADSVEEISVALKASPEDGSVSEMVSALAARTPGAVALVSMLYFNGLAGRFHAR